VKIYTFLKVLLATSIPFVWLINGMFCKVLNLVPRHALIVSTLLGVEDALMLTRIIGIGEVLIVIWILSGIKSRHCAVFQIILVATMNIIEFICVPELLLFGKFNIVFAAFFIMVIYVHEFIVKNAESTYAIK
jgi:hypothetical protein